MRSLADLTSHPRFYRLWQSPFAESKLAPFWSHADRVPPDARVLDVGCGPGTNARHFSESAYLGIDLSAKYIAHARGQYGDRFAVVDVRKDEIPGPPEFDLILANSLLHHIATPDVQHVLRTLSRRLTAKGSIHILDLVRPEGGGLSGLLASWDSGDFPRRLAEWQDLFEAAFEPVVFEPYSLPGRGPTLWNMVYFKGRRRT